MGEARHNPRSTQYAGPLPEFDIKPALGHQLVPSPAWLEANKEALAAGTMKPEDAKAEDCLLEVVLVCGMIYPSNLTDPRHWKQGMVGVQKLASVPFPAFKAAIDAQIQGATPAGASAEAPAGQAAG